LFVSTQELEILAPQLVVKGKEVDEMMARRRRPVTFWRPYAIEARPLRHTRSWVFF
jgi:hypothetical protein